MLTQILSSEFKLPLCHNNITDITEVIFFLI